MKVLLKGLVILSLVFVTSNAIAEHDGEEDVVIPPTAVPELDAAAAPLGILLIGGILAAGFERRRRASIK